MCLSVNVFTHTQIYTRMEEEEEEEEEESVVPLARPGLTPPVWQSTFRHFIELNIVCVFNSQYAQMFEDLQILNECGSCVWEIPWSLNVLVVGNFYCKIQY